MTSPWNDHLSAAGAVLENDAVMHFGDAAGELIAARDGTVLAPLSHLALISVSGDEAKTFLHNQLTSDINHLGIDALQHSAWCSAKGRMLASFIIWRNGVDYMLELANDLLAPIAKRLQMYVLRSKVVIAPGAEKRILLGLSGPQATAVLTGAGLPVPQAMQTADFPGGKVIHLEDKRFHLAIEAESASEIWRKLAANARPVGVPAWQWLDIQAGMPLVTEATKEQFVPQMANFERLGGVSFHKGCYPGQEIVARTQYLGKVKRHLYRISSPESLAAGVELFSPGLPDQSCGMVVTGVASPAGGYEGLAVLMESAVEAGVNLGSREGIEVSATAVAT